jgi:hypothetical protein
MGRGQARDVALHFTAEVTHIVGGYIAAEPAVTREPLWTTVGTRE